MAKENIISSEGISFIYVSDGNPHKNHNNLLKAWAFLFELGLNLELHLTVSKEYPRVLSAIEELQKKGLKITNHGITDVNILYNNCSHLIYPSLAESFGLGLVEAVNAALMSLRLTYHM